jgi:hypothetical protein
MNCGRASGEHSNAFELPTEAPHSTSLRCDLHALRLSVTAAWQERGVMLTPEEQNALRAEIADLCRYLADLTGLHDQPHHGGA